MKEATVIISQAFRQLTGVTDTSQRRDADLFLTAGLGHAHKRPIQVHQTDVIGRAREGVPWLTDADTALSVLCL